MVTENRGGHKKPSSACRVNKLQGFGFRDGVRGPGGARGELVFVAGPATVIGTPTLFVGDLLRAHPYDATRRFSDDSELCERWTRELGARFAISDAHVLEVGKASWDEVVVRCRMYGISDEEVFRIGRGSGWSTRRQVASLLHPARVDFVEPVTRLRPRDAVTAAPFLAAFATMRYLSWAATSCRRMATNLR